MKFNNSQAQQAYEEILNAANKELSRLKKIARKTPDNKLGSAIQISSFYISSVGLAVQCGVDVESRLNMQLIEDDEFDNELH